jgi:hypothetical protein
MLHSENPKPLQILHSVHNRHVQLIFNTHLVQSFDFQDSRYNRIDYTSLLFTSPVLFQEVQTETLELMK